MVFTLVTSYVIDDHQPYVHCDLNRTAKLLKFWFQERQRLRIICNVCDAYSNELPIEYSQIKLLNYILYIACSSWLPWMCFVPYRQPKTRRKPPNNNPGRASYIPVPYHVTIISAKSIDIVFWSTVRLVTLFLAHFILSAIRNDFKQLLHFDNILSSKMEKDNLMRALCDLRDQTASQALVIQEQRFVG